MIFEFFKNKPKGPKEERPDPEYKKYGELKEPGYAWRATHHEGNQKQGVRYTEADKLFAQQRIAKAFVRYGRDIAVRWDKIILSETHRLNDYSRGFQEAAMWQVGEKVLVKVPHDMNHQNEFANSLVEARLTLSHELFHAVGVGLVHEGLNDGEYRRMSRSGLHQTAGIERGSEGKSRSYGSLLNEALVSKLNDDGTYEQAREIFDTISERITRTAQKQNPRWSEKDTMQLFVDSYLDGWKKELMSLFVLAYGAKGFKAIMSLRPLSDEYVSALRTFLDCPTEPSDEMAEAVLALTSPEGRARRIRAVK